MQKYAARVPHLLGSLGGSEQSQALLLLRLDRDAGQRARKRPDDRRLAGHGLADDHDTVAHADGLVQLQALGDEGPRGLQPRPLAHRDYRDVYAVVVRCTAHTRQRDK